VKTMKSRVGVKECQKLPLNEGQFFHVRFF
jgi:hypothetical protein